MIRKCSLLYCSLSQAMIAKRHKLFPVFFSLFCSFFSLFTYWEGNSSWEESFPTFAGIWWAEGWIRVEKIFSTCCKWSQSYSTRGKVWHLQQFNHNQLIYKVTKNYWDWLHLLGRKSLSKEAFLKKRFLLQKRICWEQSLSFKRRSYLQRHLDTRKETSSLILLYIFSITKKAA